jgi:hypothetical protein
MRAARSEQHRLVGLGWTGVELAVLAGLFPERVSEGYECMNCHGSLPGCLECLVLSILQKLQAEDEYARLAAEREAADQPNEADRPPDFGGDGAVA